VAPHIIEKKEKHLRKEEPLMKKKIIRIGTKRKPKLTKKERFFDSERVRSPFDLCQISKPRPRRASVPARHERGRSF